MKRERAEVISTLVALFDGDSREEVTQAIEDISDSWEEGEVTDTGISQEMYNEMREKYENSVKAYRERFTQGTEKEETEEKTEEKTEVKDYEELFEEKED